MDWREVKDKIYMEWDKIQFTPPNEVLQLFKYSIVPSGQGVYGQAFTTMVLVQGNCRAMAHYITLGLVKTMDKEPSFTLDQLKILFRENIPKVSAFLGACSFTTTWDLVQNCLDAMDSIESKEQFRELLDEFCIYITTLYMWIHLYFPWNIGELFPHRKAEDVKEMVELMGL